MSDQLESTRSGIEEPHLPLEGLDPPEAASEPRPLLPVVEDESPWFLLGAVTATALLLALSGVIGLISWLVVGVGIASLLATFLRAGRWPALVGVAAVVVISVAQAIPREPTLADLRNETRGSVAAAASDESDAMKDTAPEGSLGLRIDEVADAWNSLDQPPLVRGGLIKEPGTGPLDSFVYRFDSTALLAGAYDPETELVQALLTSVRLDHDAASKMYLHLCFMLHPYSQECIDGYVVEGLDGRELDEYLDIERNAVWELEGRTWRLEIRGNVQTLRVLAPK